MIRVLQVLTRFRLGGIPNFIMSIYRNLNHEDVQFDFVIFSDEKGFYEDELLSNGSKIFRMPKFNGMNYFKVRKAWTTFFDTHKEYKILHSHVRSSASIFLPLANKRGLITIEHSHSTSNGGSRISSFIKDVFQRNIRYQAKYLFACSDIAGQWLYGKNVLNKDNYKLIPNGIDVDSFKFDVNAREIIRRQYKIPLNAFVVGHNGRFHESKNHMFLLEIFKNVLCQKENAYLLLVGGGELEPQIRNKIKELKIEDRVIITGMLKEYKALYNAMDIFVFPSKWEGLPISVVEAQASGMPCIISDKITKDVNLSKLVTYLPIANGLSIWTKTICESNTERIDVSRELKKKGFDIRETTTWLLNFYKKIIS